MNRKWSGPGQWYRKGISMPELFDMFPDEQSAIDWFENIRWPDGIRACPRCGSAETGEVPNRKPMPYWCGACRSYFSVKVGTIMESSKLPLLKWVFALYLLATNIKGVSSMKLRRDLGVTQKMAWMMAHKIRECWINEDGPLEGVIEVDETYIGDRSRNKHRSQRLGRGPHGKTPVIGLRQRHGQVRARSIASTSRVELHGFVEENVAPGSLVFTDDHSSYRGLGHVEHVAVRHSIGEYVRDMAHTNSIESFWALLKRGYVGTYHWMSDKHLDRYLNEFAGRASVRHMDTLAQMMDMAVGMVGKRMRWQDLTA